MRKWYQVEGRGPGQPIVRFSPGVLRQLGEPFVDYDQVEELAHGDLRIPSEEQVRIYMKGRSADSSLLGRANLRTRDVMVNPMASLRQIPEVGHIATLAHELSHISDVHNRPRRMKAEQMAGSTAVLAGGVAGLALYGADVLPGEAFVIYTPLFSMAALRGFYRIDPGERRARKIKNNTNLIAKYADSIYFGRPGPHAADMKANWVAGHRYTGKQAKDLSKIIACRT